MSVVVLRIQLHLPACKSLKEKRGRIKPVLARLHREFNIATAELDLHDVWQDCVLGCVTLSNDPNHAVGLMQTVIRYLETHFPEVTILDQKIEIM